MNNDVPILVFSDPNILNIVSKGTTTISAPAPTYPANNPDIIPVIVNPIR
jgi:hypothetical protein